MFFRHILNAASSNGASETNIIFPCYPYSRSDRLEENIVNQNPKRVSVMAPIVLQDMIGPGVKNLITLDIHNPTILSGHGNSRLKTTNISYSWMIEQVISDIKNNQNERWIQRDIEL
jgi:phosphoribosylpyrophosphate synthetase